MGGAWEDRAACRALPPELFFPAGPVSNAFIAQTEKASSVCRACPVQEACLSDALDAERGLRAQDREGVRGGLTGRERYALARGSRLPARPLPIPDDGREHGSRKTYRKGCHCYACRAAETQKVRSGERDLAPCGTVAAYDRHVRRGDPVDSACAAAKQGRNKALQLSVDPTAVCGTRSGYLNHTARQEVPCEACSRADQAVAWLRRQPLLAPAGR